MDFNEAEQRYHLLEEQRARGVLTLEQYRTELGRIRVHDQYGRLWMQQEQTGQWFVHHDGQWMAAAPPHRSTSAPVQSPKPASQIATPTQQSSAVSYDRVPQQENLTSSTQKTSSQSVSFDPLPGYEGNAQPVGGVQPQVNIPIPRLGGQRPTQQRSTPVTASMTNRTRAGKKRGLGCLGTGLSIVVGIPLIWGIIGTIVYFASDEDPEALYGVVAAAAISIVLSLVSALQTWKGTIVEIRTLREASHDDDYTTYKNVTYAWIRKPNGRTKKVRCDRNWRVGDQVEKRLGEFAVHHYPM